MNIYLNEILAERNISITELSKLSGIGRTTLSELNNSYTLPLKTKFDTLDKLCKTLEIALNDLIQEESMVKIVEILPKNDENEKLSGYCSVEMKQGYEVTRFVFSYYSRKVLRDAKNKTLLTQSIKLVDKYKDILNSIYRLKISNEDVLMEYFQDEKYSTERNQYFEEKEKIYNMLIKTSGIYDVFDFTNTLYSDVFKMFNLSKNEFYATYSSLEFQSMNILVDISKTFINELTKTGLPVGQHRTFNWNSTDKDFSFRDVFD
jgi:DNA-binding Xre family transcriptional regulator